MSSLPYIVARLSRRVTGGTFNYSVTVTNKETRPMLELTITNEQKVKVRCVPVTATGNPAALDGPVNFTVESGTGTVEPVDDTSAYLVSGDGPGDTIYMVTADADLGSGVENIADTITLHVEGARAANLGLVADAAEAK